MQKVSWKCCYTFQAYIMQHIGSKACISLPNKLYFQKLKFYKAE